MSAIRLEGVSKRYGAIQALDGLDLAVEPGTVFGFLGPNGAGKTTTLRILAGLSTPTAGQAWVAGRMAGSESRARALVGYLPEDPHFYGWMSAYEFLADFVEGLFSLSPQEKRARAAEALEWVGLQDVARRRIAGFSRGMRQRLGLAQALINRPQVLLLDEPVSALDPGGRRSILELIGSLKAEATVFMSTHILGDVERVCDSVGIIDRGRLVAVGERQMLLERYAIPAVEVEFAAPTATVEGWVRQAAGHPQVAGVEQHNSTVRLRLASAETGVQAVQRLVFEAGMSVLRYEVARPSLEDIFLRLVGSS